MAPFSLLNPTLYINNTVYICVCPRACVYTRVCARAHISCWNIYMCVLVSVCAHVFKCEHISVRMCLSVCTFQSVSCAFVHISVRIMCVCAHFRISALICVYARTCACMWARPRAVCMRSNSLCGDIVLPQASKDLSTKFSKNRKRTPIISHKKHT